MFKEQYTPYIKDGSLMQGEIQFHWYRTGLIALTLAAPVAALLTWNWAYIMLIAIPIFLIGCVVMDNDNFYLTSQKRIQIHLPSYHASWYDENRMEVLPEYKNAIMEYLEYLRLGQDRNEHVENELWKMHVNLFAEYNEHTNREKLMLVDQLPALKNYKILKEINDQQR